MHDAISAEKLSIPAVAIVTDRFLPTARAMVALNGLKDYPVAVVSHPISHNTEAEVRAKADAVIEQTLTILQSPLRSR